MKRKWLSILLVGAMTLSLAACGSSDSKDEKKSEEGGHKLSIMAWDPAFNIPAIQAAADDYKENVDSEFELEILEQGGSEDVETAITTQDQQEIIPIFRTSYSSRITTSTDM